MIFKQLIIFPLIIASGFGCSPEVVCAFMAKDLINAIKSIEILSFALAVFSRLFCIRSFSVCSLIGSSFIGCFCLCSLSVVRFSIVRLLAFEYLFDFVEYCVGRRRKTFVSYSDVRFGSARTHDKPARFCVQGVDFVYFFLKIAACQIF